MHAHLQPVRAARYLTRNFVYNQQNSGPERHAQWRVAAESSESRTYSDAWSRNALRWAPPRRAGTTTFAADATPVLPCETAPSRLIKGLHQASGRCSQWL